MQTKVVAHTVIQNHAGELHRINPDLTVQVNTEIPKSLTLYIPENFDMDDLVKKSPPNFKYHRDCFIYIIHLLTDTPSRNKDEEMYYVPLYSTLLQRKVRDYRKYLDYLVANGVFYENRQYLKGEKSRSFRFTKKYQTPVKPVIITKYTLIKSILTYINVKTSDNDNNDCCIEYNLLDYLSYWFSTGKLTVDFKNAEKYLWDLYEKDKKNQFNIFSSEGKKINPMARFNCRYIVLLKLYKQQFLSTVDSTAGRFHTVLTQLKSDLRQFVSYNGQKLVAIDIVNSQPYLSCVFFNKQKFMSNEVLQKIQSYNKSYNKKNLCNSLIDKVENAHKLKSVNQFIEIVKSGKLYEKFGELLLEKGILKDRDNIRIQAKKIVFSSFFSPNQSIAYNNAIVIFKEHFPDVYEIYRAIKQSRHRTLACTLQNLEANLVLHKACKIISEQRPEIPLFTLHDAIITTEGNEEYVKEILYDILLNAVGIPPTLKFERWEKVA
ncbi:hypothetical protein ETU08_08315 [Apibacter muscae]|uniref:hypothetical protein n=1 Tax=Apibacter muscae TaxID=2509004 RepID=UPI0011ADB6EE|nr:hypothetical protein [Apibacter muscae]TWP28837.1 hypothetical protein ETU08_08315 [Apibacter muscae]